MTTVANINGTNITRLRILQMGSNQSSCVLAQSPIDDNETGKYVVSVENLVISTDIPIFPKNTLAFIVFPSAANLPIGVGDEVDPEFEDLDSCYKCYVGPVYSFLDFIYQVQKFCVKYNQNALTVGTINIDSQLASKKHFGLRGSRLFWRQHILYFPDEMGRIFEGLLGGEGLYHNYLQFNPGVLEKVPLWGDRAVVQMPFATREWVVNPAAYLYYDQAWNLGASAVVSMKCKLDMFENRTGLSVDGVLPLPFEMLCLNSNKSDNAKGSLRHGFLRLDFPEGSLIHRTIVNNVVSDDMEIDQKLRTGIFRIVGDSRNSVGKKLLQGQVQDQRYELFLIKKELQADGTVKLVEEPIKFTLGDYWSMDVVFTKQV